MTIETEDKEQFPPEIEQPPVWLMAVRARAQFTVAMLESALRSAFDGETERKKSPFAASLTTSAYIEMVFGMGVVFAANLAKPTEQVENKVVEIVRSKFEMLRRYEFESKMGGGHAELAKMPPLGNS